MSRIPQSWLSENRKLLSFIFSNKLINGKKSLVSVDKLLKWLNENSSSYDIDNPEINLSTTKLRNLFSEMNYHHIVSIKQSAGVSYIIPEDEYWSLKKELTRAVNLDVPSSDIISTEQQKLTPLEHIYSKINSYSGDGKQYLQYLPKLLDLSVRILSDNRAEWRIKALLSSVIGSVVIGNTSDDEDYFDDLFIVSFALKHTYIEAPYLIKTHWIHDVDIERVLNDAYSRSRILVDDVEARTILRTLGIPNLLRSGEEFDTRLALGLISYLMGQLYNSPDKVHTIKYAEDKLLSLGIYDDVIRILDIADGQLVPKIENKVNEFILTEDEYEILMKDGY